jgi:hypothetical protein
MKGKSRLEKRIDRPPLGAPCQSRKAVPKPQRYSTVSDRSFRVTAELIAELIRVLFQVRSSVIGMRGAFHITHGIKLETSMTSR